MIDIAIFKNTSPFQKCVVLLMVFIGFSIIIPIFLMLAGMVFWGRDLVMAGVSENTPLSYLIFFQLSTQLLIFGGGALFYTLICHSDPINFLGLNAVSNYRQFVLPIIAMVLAIPLSSWLLQQVSSLSVPIEWQPVMDSMRLQEELGNRMMMRFLNVNGMGWLAFNLLFMAVIPSVCEELLFRGAVVGVLRLMLKNKHLLVLFSAILFSAIHMQFLSFLSRLVLGLVLGYAYVYSGSILPSIVAHFVNNAISVLGFYFSDRSNLAEVGSFDQTWIVLISSIAAALTVLWMQHIYNRDEQMVV